MKTHKLIGTGQEEDEMYYKWHPLYTDPHKMVERDVAIRERKEAELESTTE